MVHNKVFIKSSLESVVNPCINGKCIQFWSLSQKIKNRLQHALNGNIDRMCRSNRHRFYFLRDREYNHGRATGAGGRPNRDRGEAARSREHGASVTLLVY